MIYTAGENQKHRSANSHSKDGELKLYDTFMLTDELRRSVWRMSPQVLRRISDERSAALAQRKAINSNILVTFGQIYAEFLAANAESVSDVRMLKIMLEYEPPLGLRAEFAEIKATALMSDGSDKPEIQLETGSILADPSLGGRNGMPVLRMATKVVQGIERGLPKYYLIGRRNLTRGIRCDVEWGTEDDALEQVTSPQSFFFQFARRT